MAEKLLDFSQPFDVGLLDATVAAFYGTGSKEEVCICRDWSLVLGCVLCKPLLVFDLPAAIVLVASW
jgi:hypothetical protein